MSNNIRLSQLENAKQLISSKLEELHITPENIILQSSKVPGVKIDRKQFLKKELTPYYNKEIVDLALEYNPAYAGIKSDAIEKIANSVISYETNKVGTISFVAGIPGGTAMIATLPADAAQYFAMMLRVTQKLAYLYGFDDFELDETSINDETMNRLLICLGIMFGVQEANTAIKILADSAANKLSKSLAQKALTKTTYYPIIKKILSNLGIKINKQVFSSGVSKTVPVVGGLACGGLSYITFRKSARKLQKSFQDLPICKPETYHTTFESKEL